MGIYSGSLNHYSREVRSDVPISVIADTISLDVNPSEWFNLGTPWERVGDLAEITNPLSHYEGMCKYIAKTIREVPEVNLIYGKMEDANIYIITLLDEYDKEARRSVYRYQREILNNFPEFNFDFYVVAMNGQKPESMVSDLISLYKRED